MTPPADRPAPAVPPVVEAVDAREQGGPAVDVERWQRLAQACLVTEGAAGLLTLSFVDDDEMADLNRTHMGKDGPTDVLSFPFDDEPMGDVPVLLGDVIVAPGVAERQSTDHAGTLDDELALLVVHGILHVLGHDHAEPDETARMRALELELLQEHHWAGPAPSGFRQDHADS